MADDVSTEMLPAGVPVVAAGARNSELIGRTLGKLVLLERLGKGGSGEVFRAEQPQLGRSTVVKVLRHEVAGAPNRVERFLREAQLASRLDHPYAAHIYAFGAEPDGLLWIAMEHVRGITLDELVVKRGAMPAAIFAPLFVRLCEVVHTAHELGIIHRDIKGSNVMVIERAGQLLPKLLDFGIAKSGDSETSPGVESELTGHGVTLGSPAYMAPEQWTTPHDVDARADIYALGVLAYRCVSGVLPFQRVERAQLGDAHQHREPPPLPSSVPVQMREIIMRALAKAPDDRWPTALAFGEAIQHSSGMTVSETVPLFDPVVREMWLRCGPQPIADAILHLTSAATTVEMDAALRELVAITCRWLAVLGLASLSATAGLGDARVREHARGVIGRDDGSPWLSLARAAIRASSAPPAGFTAAIDGAALLAELSDRLDDQSRTRTAAALAADVAAAAEAFVPLEPLLQYELVVGTSEGAESWQGPRRQNRERRVVWGDPLPIAEVALIDLEGVVVARLSPLAQVVAPLPASDPELFLLWRGGRGPARLMAAPWGFERDDEAAGHRLAALSTEDSDTSAEPADERSPYPGLAAYGTADADHFFGREREIESLANRLVRTPLLAVLGPSGVGKSSFIHAGVVPRLAENYRILAIRPGRHPVRALAMLPEVSTEEPRAIAARLRELGESAQRGLLLVIDQLEELVTLCDSDVDRTQFAEILAAAASDPGAPVRVVATLRDDFATVIQAEPALRDRWDVFVLATPPAEALRRIVIEPARRMAVSVEPRVVDDMVLEVAGRAASLPLLSFTGSLLWAARDKDQRKITFGSYLEVGGVQGALATYADQVFDSLARSDQDTVRDLFARLVAADGTRIPARRDDLEQVAGARAVLEHLVDARLLVVREEDGHDVVEVVHECLTERWPRLARWRSEDAADRALLGDVQTAARRWTDGKRRADLLWRGQALAEVRRLAARSTLLTANERAFAEASARAEQAARMWRRWLVVIAMLALAIIAGVMLYLSVQAKRNASAASDAANLAEQRLTQGLIAQGRRELNDGRAQPALAYFAEALRRGADSIALREMVSIAARGWKYERRIVRPAQLSALAQDQAELVTGDQNGTIAWWPASGPPRTLATDLGDIVDLRKVGDRWLATGAGGIAIVDAKHVITTHFKPAEQVFMSALGPAADEITAGQHDAIVTYDLAGHERRRIALEPEETNWQPVFDVHGQFVLVSGQGVMSYVDLRTGARRVLDRGGIAFPAISADGSQIAFMNNDRDIQFLDAKGVLGKKLHGKNDPTGIAFTPDGKRFITYGLRSVVVYETATFEIVHQFAIEPDQVQFNLRDDDVWTGAMDGTIRRYHAGTLVASLPNAGGQIEDVALTAAGVAVVTSDSSLTVYDPNAAQFVVDPKPCAHPEPQSNSFAMVIGCEDARDFIYIGRKKIAEVADVGMGDIAKGPDEMTAVADTHLRVFDRDGKLLARRDAHGELAFIDADSLAVLDPKTGELARWNFRADRWTKLADLKDATAIAVAPGGWLIAFADGRVELRHDGGSVLHTEKLADRVEFMTVTANWVTAQLAGGGTVILDGTTATVLRVFAPADSVGTASSLDPTGELVVRPSRGTMTLWERATGDELVWNLDLAKGAVNAAVLGDGRIELSGFATGVLDIPRDSRPVDQLLRDLACRVPLQVVNSRLEPAAPNCP